MRVASLLLGVFLLFGSTIALQCMDEDGNPVDWWFVYKMPNGFVYAYTDVNDRATKLVPFDDRFLNRTDGALGSTLHQIYVNKKGLAYVSYNDEPPTSRQGRVLLRDIFTSVNPKIKALGGTTKAHAKGVVATDGTTGFWLVHSVPKFPDLGPPQFTWTADDTYAQSFLCLSLSAAAVDRVGVQLQFFHPVLFDTNIPSALASKVPNLNAVANKETQKGSNVVELTTLEGNQFTSFAKDGSWGQDLYEDLVSPFLKKGFLWETWRRQSPLPTYCTSQGYKYDSINVNELTFGDLQFAYTHDHAKLGVSIKQSPNTVCVGDINRMEAQRTRGGGTVCFEDKSLWQMIFSAITEADSC